MWSDVLGSEDKARSPSGLPDPNDESDTAPCASANVEIDWSHCDINEQR